MDLPATFPFGYRPRRDRTGRRRSVESDNEHSSGANELSRMFPFWWQHSEAWQKPMALARWDIHPPLWARWSISGTMMSVRKEEPLEQYGIFVNLSYIFHTELNILSVCSRIKSHCLHPSTEQESDLCHSAKMLRYRSFDGECNNLVYTKWGAAGNRYSRLTMPKYDDGTVFHHLFKIRSPIEHAATYSFLHYIV